MFRKFFLVCIVAAVISPSFRQTPAPLSAAPVPDYTLFHFFFVHVVRLQNAANALKVQGKQDRSMRTLMKSTAHLTNQEDAVLESLAPSCNSATAAGSYGQYGDHELHYEGDPDGYLGSSMDSADWAGPCTYPDTETTTLASPPWKSSSGDGSTEGSYSITVSDAASDNFTGRS